jgi:hypothetical protein
MNFKTLFFLFFFGLIGLTTTSFAQGSVLKEFDVYQGGELIFQIPSGYGAPSLKSFPVAGNSIELLNVSGNNYSYKYTPDPSYLGSDGFTFEVIVNPFPPIEIKDYIFQIDVIASLVDSKDDFVHLTSQDEVTIDVLSNDETSSSNLTVSIAQVLRGETIVNEDQTITYTPAGEDPDYIVYTVTDEFNTVSTSTVYISQETVPTEELTVKNYTIASGNAQYIILPNEDYTLNLESYDFGSVEQVNDFVYSYTSNNNVHGVDEVNFTDSDGNIYQSVIQIIEKYIDEGYVKDDIFYSAANTNIVFDVTLNDADDQYVIADYSEELIHMGNGVFSYTPPAYFTGIKTFFYTADDGFTEESGTIELVINNFKPTTFFEYNLSTPQNQPRVIEYDVPLGTQYFEIVSLPTHGSIEIFSDEESVDLGCEEGIQKVFAVYTPDADYSGVDDFTIKYCASDNNLCNNVDITIEVVETEVDDCICVDDCVWPGDANGDGKVSILDALSIGRFLGNGGTSRNESPFGATYEGASAENWLKNQVNGKNLKHVDANGDGIITVEDLDVVENNYGQINSIISNDVLGVKNVPFLLTTTVTEVDSGDLLVIYVTLGTQAFPAIDIQGVAFAVNLPANLVDSSSVEVEYLESGYLVKDAPYIGVMHQPYDGIIHTAGAKTNGLGSTGSGLVATVSFIVEEDAVGIKDKQRSSSSNQEDLIVTIEAKDIVIEDSRGFKYALPNTSLDIVVKSGEEESTNSLESLKLFPNPSDNYITIASTDGVLLTSVEIYSVSGSLVKTVTNINSINKDIEISDLNEGLYIVKAYSATSTYSTKLIKK